MILQAGGDVSKLEELLGFPPGYLGGAPLRVDVPNPSGLSIPSGNEGGVNEFWIPGGYTSGGLVEAVIDSVPVSECIVTEILP